MDFHSRGRSSAFSDAPTVAVSYSLGRDPRQSAQPMLAAFEASPVRMVECAPQA